MKPAKATTCCAGVSCAFSPEAGLPDEWCQAILTGKGDLTAELRRGVSVSLYLLGPVG